MRIFYAVPSSPHGSIPKSKVWRQNLYLHLKDLGHEVIEFKFNYWETNENLNPNNPVHKAFIDKNRPKLSEELLKQVTLIHKKRAIDVFFSYFYSSYVFPETIRQISRLGITTINWYCNGSYQFDLVSEIAPAYNFCLVPEKFRTKNYKAIGANPIYCQEAANPNFYKPYNLKKEYDVTFVGQKYGNRPEYVRYLFDHGIDVKVWGPRWTDKSSTPSLNERLSNFINGKVVHDWSLPLEKSAPPLSDIEMVRLYSRSKISLGFTKLWKSLPGEVDKQVRLRDFEAPMSGAFYLVEQFDELEEFFIPGKEIETFSSKEELLDKTRFYLANESKRDKIRLAGLKRARKDHTWQKRLRDSFKVMKLM